MLQAVADQLQMFLGYERDIGDVDALQMALRTIIVYVATLVLIRLGSKRFLSQATAFDVIVGIMLGSVMSRAINSSAPLFPTLGAGLVFVGLHKFLAMLAARTDWFGSIVKGKPVLLIEDGKVQQQGMRRADMSEHDLEQALRMQGQEADPAGVERAYLERGGSVSVIPAKSQPRVLEVRVEDGVQTVRIELK